MSSKTIKILNIICPEKNCAAQIEFHIDEHSSGFPSRVDKKTITRWPCDQKGGKCSRSCEVSEEFQKFKNEIEQI